MSVGMEAVVEMQQKIFDELCRFGGEFECVDLKPEEGISRFRIYTDNHRYAISMRGPSEEKMHGYLGCVVSCRKPYAGEDHTRGNDLADGPLTAETWEKIKADIIAFEMVKLAEGATRTTGTSSMGVADPLERYPKEDDCAEKAKPDLRVVDENENEE